MESVKILKNRRSLDWEYDGDADVLYISVAPPKPALGVDIGEGIVVRYDEARGEAVGLSIVGLHGKMPRELSPATPITKD